MNRESLMFHEVLTDSDISSGFSSPQCCEYSINFADFKLIVDRFGNEVYYTFDDGGESNLIAMDYLFKYGVKGVFCIPTAYIGTPGFLSKSDIIYHSIHHNIVSHGHNHLMNCFDFQILKNDWSQSLFILGEILGKKIKDVALPGGTFSKIHYRVLKELEVERIYHSAPSNVIMRYLYGDTFQFIPRKLVVSKEKSKFSRLIKIYINPFIKQIFYYFKYRNHG